MCTLHAAACTTNMPSLTVASQVILSFLEGNTPDWDSCHAAYAAYMRLSEACPKDPQDSVHQQQWQTSADQLATDIAAAQAAANTSAAIPVLMQKYPRSSVLQILQAAVHDVRHRWGQDDDISNHQLSCQGKTIDAGSSGLDQAFCKSG